MLPANIPDNQVYLELISSSSLSPEIIMKTQYMVADPVYDDRNLYELSMYMGFQLVCPEVDTEIRQKKD